MSRRRPRDEGYKARKEDNKWRANSLHSSVPTTTFSSSTNYEGARTTDRPDPILQEGADHRQNNVTGLDIIAIFIASDIEMTMLANSCWMHLNTIPNPAIFRRRTVFWTAQVSSHRPTTLCAMFLFLAPGCEAVRRPGLNHRDGPGWGPVVSEGRLGLSCAANNTPSKTPNSGEATKPQKGPKEFVP